MTYAAKIVADSRASGTRLTSIEVTFPRFILAEFNTHRVFSRNSASSRAIPVERRIAQVRANPFVPEAFTKNRKGMQADEIVGEGTHVEAHQTWLEAAEAAARYAEHLAEIGVHKQHANRLLEPFVWHTVIVTATEWENFFALRTDKAAQPEMQITAKLMRDAMAASEPRDLREGEWHLPYTTAEERETHRDEGLGFALVKMSVVRCAAVSFERQDAERTLTQMCDRHDDLAVAGHWSPFEHQAKVATPSETQQNASWFSVEHPEVGQTFTSGFIGNFRAPWLQYRKMFHGERVWRAR